jgi:hypothetical protein
MLIATKQGASQSEIGRILGVSDRAVRRLLGQKWAAWKDAPKRPRV